MKNLTLTQERTVANEAFLFIRLDGAIVKCFTIDDETSARRFFETFMLPTESMKKVLCEKQLEEEGDSSPTQSEPKPWIHGEIIIQYRGAVVTDKPYKFNSFSPNWEHFTIVIEGRVWDHCDEETLEDMLDTIDEIMNQMEDKQISVEPMPEWREKEIARRLAKIKERQAITDMQRERLTDALNKIDELTVGLEKGGATL